MANARAILNNFSMKTKHPVEVKDLAQEGPSHAPTFLCEARVGDLCSQRAQGHTKKKAATAACQSIVEYFVQCGYISPDGLYEATDTAPMYNPFSTMAAQLSDSLPPMAHASHQAQPQSSAAPASHQPTPAEYVGGARSYRARPPVGSRRSRVAPTTIGEARSLSGSSSGSSSPGTPLRCASPAAAPARNLPSTVTSTFTAKSVVMEYCQKTNSEPPRVEAQRSGSDHCPVFEAQLTAPWLDDGRPFFGTGRRKKEAELDVFEEVLVFLVDSECIHPENGQPIM